MSRLIKSFSNHLITSNKIFRTQLIDINRKWSSSAPANSAVTEEEIKKILQVKFPQSQTITVEDVSGGCGAMFNIFIESSEFQGLSIPKQHRKVYDTLKEQIKNIHGLHLETKVPK